MDIKKRYRLYSRIAIGISIIISAIITQKLSTTLAVNFGIIFFGSFSFSSHLLLLIICYKKEKAIDKKFGFIKINGDRWLGYDGFWHDGLNEVYKRKLDRYFENGGNDFGYLPSKYMKIAFALGCAGGLVMVGGGFGELFAEYFFAVVVLIALLVYAIIREAILG